MILLMTFLYGVTGGNPIVMSLAAIAVVTWFLYRRFHAIRLPGPMSLPVLGNIFQMDRKRPFLTFHRWYKKYGGIYKMQLPAGERVVVSGYDELYEVLVSKGRDFAGRFSFWRMEYAFKSQGIIQHKEPDDKWRALRKLTHSHIKQYGDGLSRLEVLVNKIAEDMFNAFTKHSGTAIDPRNIIFKAGLKTMSFLLIGKTITEKDPLFHKIKEYESLAFENVSQVGSWHHLLLDKFPWLRHFYAKVFSKVHRVKVLDKEIWEDMKERVKDSDNYNDSLGELLKQAVKFPARLKASADVSLSDFDAQRAALSVLVAGIGTTSMTFYAMVNVLATHPDVQLAIKLEVRHALAGQIRDVSLQDRQKLPYTRACVYEILRYSSTVVVGVTHRALVDTKIRETFIPKNTSIITNLFGLHHDEEFWGNPYAFRPERFLTPDGEVVPADHPNRKHILPFGSGPRVCLGEGLAMSRLFLWLANLCRRVNVVPSDPRDQVDPDPRGYEFHGGLLRHPPYKVRFIERPDQK